MPSQPRKTPAAPSRASIVRGGGRPHTRKAPPRKRARSSSNTSNATSRRARPNLLQSLPKNMMREVVMRLNNASLAKLAATDKSTRGLVRSPLRIAKALRVMRNAYGGVKMLEDVLRPLVHVMRLSNAEGGWNYKRIIKKLPVPKGVNKELNEEPAQFSNESDYDPDLDYTIYVTSERHGYQLTGWIEEHNPKVIHLIVETPKNGVDFKLDFDRWYRRGTLHIEYGSGGSQNADAAWSSKIQKALGRIMGRRSTLQTLPRWYNSRTKPRRAPTPRGSR